MHSVRPRAYQVASTPSTSAAAISPRALAVAGHRLWNCSAITPRQTAADTSIPPFFHSRTALCNAAYAASSPCTPLDLPLRVQPRGAVQRHLPVENGIVPHCFSLERGRPSELQASKVVGSFPTIGLPAPKAARGRATEKGPPRRRRPCVPPGKGPLPWPWPKRGSSLRSCGRRHPAKW